MTTSVTGFRSRLAGEVPFWVRGLTIALFLGGLSGAITNFLSTFFWPWVMPVLAHRFLAGAATAYVVGSLLTLFLAGWLESELLMTTTIVYGIFLGLAVVLQYDVIDWSKPIAWSFILLVMVALIITGSFLWGSFRRAHRTAETPLAALLRIYLLILGIVTLAVGLLVYIVPKSAGFVWPWADLKAWATLDSRLVASMLLTIAAGAFVTVWRNEYRMARVFLPMICGYCIVGGLGIALHAASTPAFVVPDVIYLIIFAVILAINTVALIKQPR